MQSVTGIRLFGIRLAIVALTIYWCVIFTGTHLPKLPSEMPRVNDKILHFSAFFMLATFLCYCTNSTRLWRRFGSIALVCMTYGVFDELTQFFIAGRYPDAWDFIADVCGALTAISLYFLGRVQWGKRTSASLAK